MAKIACPHCFLNERFCFRCAKGRIHSNVCMKQNIPVETQCRESRQGRKQIDGRLFYRLAKFRDIKVVKRSFSWGAPFSLYDRRIGQSFAASVASPPCFMEQEPLWLNFAVNQFCRVHDPACGYRPVCICKDGGGSQSSDCTFTFSTHLHPRVVWFAIAAAKTLDGEHVLQNSANDS